MSQLQEETMNGERVCITTGRRTRGGVRVDVTL